MYKKQVQELISTLKSADGDMVLEATWIALYVRTKFHQALLLVVILKISTLQ